MLMQVVQLLRLQALLAMDAALHLSFPVAYGWMRGGAILDEVNGGQLRLGACLGACTGSILRSTVVNLEGASLRLTGMTCVCLHAVSHSCGGARLEHEQHMLELRGAEDRRINDENGHCSPNASA